MLKNLFFFLAILSCFVTGCQVECCKIDEAVAMEAWPVVDGDTNVSRETQGLKEFEVAIDTTETEEVIDLNGGLQEVDLVVEDTYIPIALASASLEVEVPDRVYKENTITYTMTVNNLGNDPISELVVKNRIDRRNTFYVSSSPEGSFREEHGVVTWVVTDLPPLESKIFQVEVLAKGDGEIVSQSLIKSNEVILDKKESKTEIHSSIGLQIDHSDTDDPVEVNSTTSYVIKVSNQGIKDAHNLRITNTIPSQTTFVSAEVEGTGEIVEYSMDGQNISFTPIPIVELGQTVTYRITVQVVEEGDLLNSFTIDTDDFGKTLTSQEPTKAVLGE